MTARLEELKPDAQVRGLVGREAVRIVTAQMMGEAAQVVYRDGQGTIDTQILFRDKEAELEIVSGGRKWSFEGDGDQFRLVSEADRIRLAYLFDPYVAVSGSAIDPLPHQISAVYEQMLPRQPMRFLLADDPGAGKTIMAGRRIKELLIRGELERCLIVAPGSLSEQWQDELKEKFELQFELLTREAVKSDHLLELLERRALVKQGMDTS
ncbi:MAG: DEAD/DEAH box helicase family protein, partial [Synechococcaceae cyanobacterium]